MDMESIALLNWYQLALRNAKRSVFDYLLYNFTATILVAIMCVSNCIAALGHVAAGFQTVSLPLLIVLIMVVLVASINDFMVKQRAKEFATYLLLGMEQRRLSLLFLLELSIMGTVCFVLGTLLGAGVYLLFFSAQAGVENAPAVGAMTSGILQTFIYFCFIQILSALRIRRKLQRLQIHALMTQKRQNQPLQPDKQKQWGIGLLASLVVFFAMLCGVVFLPNHQADMLLSLLAVPMLGAVFLFYKWLYAYFSKKRVACSEEIYKGTRLYQIAEITSNATTGAGLNFIFCSCLLFSAVSFVFGVFLQSPALALFTPSSQQWMAFLQISICILFLVIYCSILSLFQIVECKQQTERFKILHYMGKSRTELKALLRTQILVKLFLPTWMCFALLGTCAPLVNRKLNAILPPAMHNMLFGALGSFVLCFFAVSFSYFFIVNLICKRSLP